MELKAGMSAITSFRKGCKGGCNSSHIAPSCTVTALYICVLRASRLVELNPRKRGTGCLSDTEETAYLGRLCNVHRKACNVRLNICRNLVGYSGACHKDSEEEWINELQRISSAQRLQML